MLLQIQVLRQKKQLKKVRKIKEILLNLGKNIRQNNYLKNKISL